MARLSQLNRFKCAIYSLAYGGVERAADGKQVGTVETEPGTYESKGFDGSCSSLQPALERSKA